MDSSSSLNEITLGEVVGESVMLEMIYDGGFLTDAQLDEQHEKDCKAAEKLSRQ